MNSCSNELFRLPTQAIERNGRHKASSQSRIDKILPLIFAVKNKAEVMMEFAFIFCLLVGLKGAYSDTIIEMTSVTEETFTFHTMTLPPEAFQQTSVPEVPGQIFVRDRSSPEPPMIFFNNGDIQHIIEEMHFTPRQQEMQDDGDDCDMMIKFFSINPDEEDLGQAMKKNSYVETRLPVFLQPISAQEAPTNFIPQAPSQRTAFQQLSPQARYFNIVPTKPSNQQLEPQNLPFSIIPLRKLSEQELSQTEPSPQKSEFQGKVEKQNIVNPLRDQVMRVNLDGKELNSKEVKDIVNSGVFDRLLESLSKEPFSSAQNSIEQNKESVSKNDVNSSKIPELKSPTSSSSRTSASGPIPMSFSRTFPTSSDDLPQINRTPAPNVLRLDDVPIELLKFIDLMNGDGQSMFSSGFFNF